MSRRHKAEHRQVVPDPKFGSVQVARFITTLMKDGKKAVAEKIIYGAMEVMEKQIQDQNSLDALYTSLKNVAPTLEVRSRRVGGSTYQIPVEVREERRLTLAIRWLIDAARKRNEKSMEACLAAELIEAFHNRGTAVKKKEDTHKMAEANRAFAHYMW